MAMVLVKLMHQEAQEPEKQHPCKETERPKHVCVLLRITIRFKRPSGFGEDLDKGDVDQTPDENPRPAAKT
eukprot:CAMPEP_0172666608 /NCGR_PEP_ID=MMETSP1074-20121228/7903_1 /TAXON_ID=2916 /ORGANISM="Ceratium fusus, Strain PA161109" /LENGTH=70 /DNA_ID=CAMNT_0013483003 /DNA_START=12 /DNA_END=221 /DNA_ORIENTATION=+